MIRVRSVLALVVASAVAWVAAASGSVACSNSEGVPSDAGVDAKPSSGPYLTALSVSTSANGPSLLVPGFSPIVHDYYVRCASGPNALSVTMTASPGAKVALRQPTTSGSSPHQVLSVSVKSNQAIVAAASDATGSDEYWVRCLPPDFPKIAMTRYPAAGAPVPGYYILGNQPIVAGGPGYTAYAFVLDSNGVPVWYLRDIHEVWNADNLVPGAISFRPLGGVPEPLVPSRWEIHHLAPFETSYVTANPYTLDSHELQRLPNGHFLVLTKDVQTGVDLTGVMVPLPDGGTKTLEGSGDIRPCMIREVDEAGKVHWNWDATEHFDPRRDTTFPELSPSAGPLEIDPFHCNSIDIDPANGNLLVSARHMDSVFYVERPSGKVLWKMGGSMYTKPKDDAVYVHVDSPFFRQHDARIQPGWSSACSGSGQISVFDDETATGSPARGVVYDVIVAADGSAKCKNPGATVAWQYATTTSSYIMGSFRIHADGSRTIGWGLSAESGLGFTEIDAHGNALLDFNFTDGCSSYRAVKVPLTALDLGVMRSTAGAASP